MLRAAAPRILAVVVAVVGGTTAISTALGALSGSSIAHSLATGYYVVGAAVLVASFVMGSRGPWRSETEEEGMGTLRPRTRRHRRRATSEERAESKRSSLGLFVLGVALVLLGALVDPSRRAF